MGEYIEREKDKFIKLSQALEVLDSCSCWWAHERMERIPAADVRPVVLCRDCKHNNACLTQSFVEDESRVPFDRNTFFCADGKRADDA